MKRNRSTLRDYFKKGAIPTEANFADLIDSMINQDEDSLSKLPNDPLHITANGGDEGLINFYRVEQGNPVLTWQIKQKPDGKSGLSIGEATGSRLFIESGTGSIIWGNQSQLQTDQGGSIELGGNGNTPGSGTPYIDFHYQGKTQDFNTRIINDGDGQLSIRANTLNIGGNVGIGTVNSGAKLDIKADATTAGGWYEAIRFSQDAHSAITHPGGGLLFGLHGNRNFYFADIKGGVFQKYVMQIAADTGNVSLSGNVAFGTQTRQMLNLWSTNYGIGIQAGTQYYRTDAHFAWYRGGSHNDNQLNPGGGTRLMSLDSSGNLNMAGKILQENWKEIGASGAPGFQSGWTNYGSGYNTAGYFKDSLGIVHLKGLVKNGLIGDQTIFTLPAGYRPANRELHATFTDNQAGRLDITTDGRVIPVQGGPAWFSLDGVTFRAKLENIIVVVDLEIPFPVTR